MNNEVTLRQLEEARQHAEEMLRKLGKSKAHETTVNYWDGKANAYADAMEIVRRNKGA